MNIVYQKPEHWQKQYRHVNVDIHGNPTLDKVLALAEEIQREHGLSLKDIAVYNNVLGYKRLETDEEFEERKARMEDSDRRHREFIKRRYAEIMEDENQ